MWRGPPEPSTGLLPATSGVAQEQPNCPPAPAPGSSVGGGPKLVQLKILKNSARNWALYRSLNFHSFETEKSALK